MAIKISNLQPISDSISQQDALFVDLRLDFKTKHVFSKVLGLHQESNDILMDYNESAIKNSLINLFNTRPGQRFLFPEYGLDLNEYIFEEVTEALARVIGQRITQAIYDFEPRVKLIKCIVVAEPDNNLYDITVVIEMPAFATSMNININLDIKTKSFAFTETSKNR